MENPIENRNFADLKYLNAMVEIAQVAVSAVRNKVTKRFIDGNRKMQLPIQ
jgi:hypothetical protein